MDHHLNISPQWVEAQYQIWKTAPQQLSEDWQCFFQGFELGQQEPTPGVRQAELVGAEALVRSYREHGHLQISRGPLYPAFDSLPQFQLSNFDLTDGDLETLVAPRNYNGAEGALQQLIAIMQQAYCQRIGCEFIHIPIESEQCWLQDRLEGHEPQSKFNHDDKRAILHQLEQASAFENFLHKRFVGQKRFSLEGCEGLIPMLKHLMECCGQQGIVDMVMGMPHRGRLNVLAYILGKPLENIFAEFAGQAPSLGPGAGDVKYHHGFSNDWQDGSGNRLHLTLVSNPSHLEAVNPVVEGKCRARQDLHDGDPQQILPVLIHGEAAFAGQGIVAENFNLSQLRGYRTEGTLHLVINNQIGFTTQAVDSRSTCYPTDIAKMLLAPIFHVSGDDPEALLRTVELALAFRQQFRKDVVIEIICYRRYGHNENDEPQFTQPLLYEKIQSHPISAQVYRHQLEDEGVVLVERQQFLEQIMAPLEAAHDKAAQPLDAGFAKRWQDVVPQFDWVPVATAVPRAELLVAASGLVHYPEAFKAHPKVAQLLKKRFKQIQDGQSLDWGSGEALAFATLLSDGVSIRLSGQDSQRGTFSHRHAVLIDCQDGHPHVPLAEIAATHGSRFQVFNSMLSEAAVLGFEYGYSVETPQALTIWEAQFGDFANGAQVVIDQFICCSESKWNRLSGLVLFLPHGYEGQGAEHSSARIERYLQLCGENNLQVVFPSTPAQLFHLLRRQIHQKFRRPLIAFTPKGLLRHPQCRSPLVDFSDGSFQSVIADDLNSTKVKRLLLCTGHIYYELWQYRQDQQYADVALIRIEQLYPLDSQKLQTVLAGYESATEFVWVQEEPENNGAWSFLRSQLKQLLGVEPVYCGRSVSATTAVGSHIFHQQQQQQLVVKAFARAKKG